MPIKSQFADIAIPTDVTLPGLLLSKADKHPDAIATIDGLTGKEMTYGQFSTLIRSTAASMHLRGLRKGDVVFLLSPNCVEFFVVYMAATSIGAIMSAVNPLSTEEELLYYMNDSQPVWMVVYSAMADTCLKAAASYGKLKEKYVIGPYEGETLISELYEGSPNDVPDVEIVPQEDVSAILYSSGTTGRPKGVMLTHYNQIVNLFQATSYPVMRLMEDRDFQTFVLILPFYHVAGLVFGLLLLFEGRTGVIFPKFDLLQYLKALQDYKVRAVLVVPPIAVLLAKHPLVDDYKLDTLQHLIVGAAPLGKDIELQVKERLGLKTIRQVYGMTENGPATHVVPTDVQKPGSVGILLPNNECMVVDPESGRELGVNEDGEMWIKSPGMMKGYLNRPVATADCITPDDFCKSGDIGHYDEDGHFFIVDRMKELIKYNGYQVAPADLEAVLLTHPDVADAAVIGVPDEAAGELPRAYVVKKKDAAIVESDLVAYVSEYVAYYKRIRGGVVFIDVIPKSPSGKILRRILREQVNEELQRTL